MRHIRTILEVLLYVMVFLTIQLFVTYLVGGIQLYIDDVSLHDIAARAANGTMMPDATGMIIISVVSSVLTLLLFLLLHWTPATRDYLLTRPWTAMAWVVILALGTIIPSTWLSEQIPYDMPAEMEALLADMMRNRWGYLAIGILAPLAEEAVFRGAVLRVLLRLFDKKWHWIAIAISAILFGLVHGNVQQFVHATLIGLILGWMYYRTDSILPGVLFHWVNNSAAYVISNLIPNAEQARLIDIFGGEQRSVWLALLFSLCLMLPALFQLFLRLKKKD
ncbi:MAG: CPBP family intramembrane metalloprotease [Prevotella sp.]|nr:CPBP family intramembrane metalloprotease [Prevotella sp.]